MAVAVSRPFAFGARKEYVTGPGAGEWIFCVRMWVRTSLELSICGCACGQKPGQLGGGWSLPGGKEKVRGDVSHAPQRYRYTYTPTAYLGHPFGGNKGAALDGGEAGPGEPLDQLDLGGEGDGLLLVLQAVAGPDLDDPHGVVGTPLLLLLLLAAGASFDGEAAAVAATATTTATARPRGRVKRLVVAIRGLDRRQRRGPCRGRSCGGGGGGGLTTATLPIALAASLPALVVPLVVPLPGAFAVAFPIAFPVPVAVTFSLPLPLPFPLTISFPFALPLAVVIAVAVAVAVGAGIGVPVPVAVAIALPFLLLAIPLLLPLLVAIPPLLVAVPAAAAARPLVLAVAAVG